MAAAAEPAAVRAHRPAIVGACWMLTGMSAIAVVDGVAKMLAASLHGMQVAWGYFAQFNIVTRMLGATDRPITTLFHTFAIGTVLLSFAMPLVWSAPSAREWLIFASSGALGLFAHYAIYRSLMLADASVVAPLNYVRLLWAIGIGFVAFGDVPDAMTLIGGAITITSGLYVMLWNAR